MKARIQLIQCIYADRFEPGGFGQWESIVVYLPEFDRHIQDGGIWGEDFELIEPHGFSDDDILVTDLGEF